MKVISVDPAVSLSTMSLDHPGWLQDVPGRVRRAFRLNDTVWTAISDTDHVMFDPAENTEHPVDPTAVSALVDRFDSASLPVLFRLTVPFRASMRVQRMRNPDLWDALLPPIFRQRRSAHDAKRQYQQFCINHGSIITTPAGLALLPPTPETVVELPDDAFIKLGIRDKGMPLRAAAATYLDRAPEWDTLPPTMLITELQTMTYVGRWTAGAVVADLTNDYSFYAMPVDMAYRHCKELLADPSVALPEQRFTKEWTNLTPAHRSTLIVLILAALHRQHTTDHLAGEAKNAQP